MKAQFENSPLATFNFYLQGVGCLLGWNAVLTALGFFGIQYPDIEVSFVFPLPIFIFNLLLCPVMPQIAKRVSLDNRIAVSNAIQIIILILLPLIGATMANTAGFVIIMIILAFLGAMNTVSTASCAGLAANFPFSNMSSLISGYGLAGIIMNIIMAICLGIFGPDGGVKSIATYFSCAVGITLLCIVMHYKFVKTPYAQYHLNKATQADAEDGTSVTRGGQELGSQINFDSDNTSVISNNQVAVADVSGVSLLQPTEPVTLGGVWKEIWLYSLLMILNYVQTFWVFPGVALMKKLDSVDIAWSILILIFTWNLCDTIAKMLTGYRNFYNKYSIAGMVLFRFLFFITFIILAKNKSTSFINTDWFAILNIGVFSFMNGYHTGSLFIMGPESVKDHKKETAGFIMQLSLYIGIISGTFLAFTLAGINKD